MRILITGGAGFIGTHLTRHLLAQGHAVTILDNFLSQVHGDRQKLSDDIAAHIRLVVGDVADTAALSSALDGADAIVHLAAETGTGQSMYEVSRYARTNLQGTALIYDLLAKTPKHNVRKIVVASSRAIYGEGAYHCAHHGVVYPRPRTSAEKKAALFDPVCPICSEHCESVPTPESAPLQPSSYYGLTKQVQEKTVLLFGETLGISSMALRYQNVYGPGQSLENPYTGILAIFSNLARTGRQLQIFEDGLESRDFVYVDDVVCATACCVVGDFPGTHCLNIGSGVRTSVLEVANGINDFYGGHSKVKVTGEFRDGDIRHGLADLSLAQSLLQYEPKWGFGAGLRKFLEWAGESQPIVGAYEQSLVEMKEKGLLHGHR